jgi:hypothetical protein
MVSLHMWITKVFSVSTAILSSSVLFAALLALVARDATVEGSVSVDLIDTLAALQAGTQDRAVQRLDLIVVLAISSRTRLCCFD